MSTQASKFEEALKQSLSKDLIFRIVVWSVISWTGAYLSLQYFAVEPLDYLNNLGKSILRLLNILGTFSLIMSIPALMSKDMEQALSNPQYKEWTCGWIAGFIRRVAGDMALWSLGATVTLITSIFVVATVAPLPAEDYPAAALALGCLLMSAIMFAMSHLYIKRQGPSPLLVATKNPLTILITYISILFLIVCIGFICPIVL